MEGQITAVQKLINTAIEFLVKYSFQVVGAIIILIVGFFLANSVCKYLTKLFQRKKLDVTLSKFIAGVVKIIILAFAFLIALGGFGITIAPFIAALGALAFGASMAIQGPLSNYGAGISIILSRPFVVGDTINVAGVNGLVKEVKLAATVLTNEDGILITVPNKEIVGQILHNSGACRIAEGVVGISYQDDPDKAIGVIAEFLAKMPDVVKDPRPQIGIKEFGDSSINIEYRFWTATSRYFQNFYAVNLGIYKALKQSRISIPYPQREVRVLSHSQEPKIS